MTKKILSIMVPLILTAVLFAVPVVADITATCTYNYQTGVMTVSGITTTNGWVNCVVEDSNGQLEFIGTTVSKDHDYEFSFTPKRLDVAFTVTIKAQGTDAPTVIEFETDASSQTVSGATGNEFIYLVDVQRVSGHNLGSSVFQVTYDPRKLKVIDLAAQTAQKETTTGKIAAGEVTILSHENGVIRFTVDKPVPAGQTFTGAVNAIRFQYLSNQSTEITVQMGV